MIQRVLRWFAVDDDSLAVDVIAHAMDTTHNFLSQKHTRKYLHAGEVWQGRLGIAEMSWEMWQNAGSPTAIDRAQHEADRILQEHRVDPLSDEQNRPLDEILNTF